MKATLESIIELNLAQVRRRIADAARRSGRDEASVTLVAVTKYTSLNAARALYDMGLRDFGESRPQAIVERAAQLPPDIRWHLIGHWQTNKVRRTLPVVRLLHSLDRIDLLEALEKELHRSQGMLEALIEVNLTGEAQKHGFSAEALRGHWSRIIAKDSPLSIRGLMAMGRFDASEDEWRATFSQARRLRDELAESATQAGHRFDHLSMGMSADLETAIAEGSTLVRVGSALFEGLDDAADS